MTDLTRLRDGLKRFASGFTPGQKAVSVVAVLATVVGGIFVMSYASKPNYSPLFTGVQSSDVASITTKLSADKVPYKLTDGDTTVEVPASDVDKERLSLAQAGLPASGTVGLSLLDKEGITASNLTQQADYLQALQGELEQTIDSIQGVASSQVNIALPANEDFALNNDSPTGASVMVTMEGGQSLTSGNVEAIVHLVSSSVPNLDADDVTVADSTGDLLAGPGMPAGAGGADTDTASYDSAVQAKVLAYLTAVLGASNADVQVNATLDYDQVSTSTQKILPAADGKTASFCTSTDSTDENYTGTGTPPGGTAGTVTTTASGTQNGNYTQTSNNQTCETNQETETDQQAPGTVSNQSVAVLVNSKAIPSDVSLSALEQGVSAAAGIDTARGDKLAFSSMPFDSASSAQAAKAAAASAAATKKQSMDSLIRTAVVLMVIGLVLFLLWRSARKARRSAAPALLSASDLAALQALRPADEPTGRMVALPSSEPKVTTEMHNFIDSQPEEVAELLRGWLEERKELSAP